MTGRRVLAVVAHPDDEVLGCGGALALHADYGDTVISAIGSRGRPESEWEEPGSGPKAAAAVLGISSVEYLDLPDQRFESAGSLDIITRVESVVQRVRPHVVYTHHGGDVNLDHQLMFNAVLVATRPLERQIEGVYSFETASSTEWGHPRTFVADTWLDISSVLDRKLAAMKCYSAELRPYPHPRSLKALEYRARHNGSLSCIDAAEVFMTIRRVVRDGKTLV